MAKHIHIYLGARTGDSGNFDESKHKRDDGGKFSSTGGGGASKAAPIKHSTGTGQSFLPKQGSIAQGSVVKTGSGFTAKSPTGMKEFFKPGEEAKAKAWSEGKSHSEIAKMAEAHAEGQEQVRAQAEANEKAMPKNSHVKLPDGKTGIVLGHRGNMVLTNKGEFHATKIQPAKEQAVARATAAKESGTERSYEGKGNHKPGWMLRADSGLANKVKESLQRKSVPATKEAGPGKTSEADVRKKYGHLSPAELSKTRGASQAEQRIINQMATEKAKPAANAVPGQRGLAPASREDQVLQAKQQPAARSEDPADHGFASMSIGQRHAFSQQGASKTPHLVPVARAIEMKKALVSALGPQADVKAHTGGEAGSGQAVLTKRVNGQRVNVTRADFEAAMRQK